MRKVSSRVTCPECIDMLLSQDEASLLIYIRNNGGLIVPSQLVRHMLECCEHVFRMETRTTERAVLEHILIKSVRKFMERHEEDVLQTEHYCSEPQHVIALIRETMRKYILLRLHELSRRITERSQKVYMRSKLTKQILFLNQ